MMALEGNMDFSGLIVVLVLIMIGPPVLLTIIGFIIKKNSPKAAKILFVFGALYLLVGLGICGSLIS